MTSCIHDGQRQFIEDKQGMSYWYCIRCGTTLSQYEDMQGG